MDKFKGLAKVKLHDGRTCLLWSDLWVDRVPELNFPELFSFAKDKKITVRAAKNLDSLQDLFHLPLSEEALLPVSSVAEHVSRFSSLGL